MPSLKEYIRAYVLDPTTGGLVAGGSPADEERSLFVGNEEAIKRTLLREYATWYEGDGDRLLHMYAKDNMIDFATEPWFWKNRRAFFWSVSSAENDVKRTHSGQPANIINTMCNIVGKPKIKGPENLEPILQNCEFYSTYKDEQLPMTLVEGWGCWKIGWDLDVSDHPYIIYYRAENVDFIKKNGKTVAIVFYDWYKGRADGERYLVTEIRRIDSKVVDNKIHRSLIIESKVWRFSGDDNISEVTGSDVAGLIDINETVIIDDFDELLAVPCILFKDATNSLMPGKSVFSNKIALFDMLDGILSQEDNSVQKSTVEELFNTDFLERDENNMPIIPNRYDRKYTTFAGGRTADGGQMSDVPVQVTQPAINFSVYSNAAIDVLSHILSGYMSPATIGIGVATQSTALSQREKEKVTISTRNNIADSEVEIISKVCKSVLWCDNYLKTGKMNKDDYDVSVVYDEFPDVEFAEKAQVYSGLLAGGMMTPELFVNKMYDGESDTVKDNEIALLKLNFDKREMMKMMGGPVPPDSGEITGEE